jgi:hypothetical protein
MARHKSKGFPEDRVETKVTVGRFTDESRNLMVETRTTVTWTPLHVDFADIMDACTIVPDDYAHEPPWDDCDGYEHTAIPARRYDHDMDEARGCCWSEGQRQRVVIELLCGRLHNSSISI